MLPHLCVKMMQMAVRVFATAEMNCFENLISRVGLHLIKVCSHFFMEENVLVITSEVLYMFWFDLTLI